MTGVQDRQLGDIVLNQFQWNAVLYRDNKFYSVNHYPETTSMEGVVKPERFEIRYELTHKRDFDQLKVPIEKIQRLANVDFDENDLLKEVYPMTRIEIVVGGLNPNSKGFIMMEEAIEDVIGSYGGTLHEANRTENVKVSARVHLDMQVEFDVDGKTPEDLDEGIFCPEFLRVLEDIGRALDKYNGGVEHYDVCEIR